MWTRLALCAASLLLATAPLQGCEEADKGGSTVATPVGVPDTGHDPDPPVDTGPPAEGEGEGAAEGEGEGEGEGGNPDQPPREVQIACGSVPSRVVQPDALVVTATVVLPADICAAHLQPLTTPHDPRQLRFVAYETKNAPACQPQRRTAFVEYPLRLRQPDQAGEWTIEMIGDGPTIFRKVVRVDSEGAAEVTPEEAGETCAGRTGFVGECGVDLFCNEPNPRVDNPRGYLCSSEEGRCAETAEPGEIAGEFVVEVASVQKSCQGATEVQIPADQCDGERPPPEQLLDNELEVAPATLTLVQDPEGAGNRAAATVSFSGNSFLARWSGAAAIPGRVIGATFLGEETAIEVRAGACFRKYVLQLPGLTRYGDRLTGKVGVVSLEAYCERGCLFCDYGGTMATPQQ